MRIVPESPRSSRRAGRGAALALLVLLTPGCTFLSKDEVVLITSTPAGAEIFLDGTDTGETTPARLDLSSIWDLGGFLGGDRLVTIRKTGFEPERRVLHHHAQVYTSKWVDGATDFEWITMPLHWTFGDFFTPFGTRSAYVPKELHVQLYPEGEAPGKRP